MNNFIRFIILAIVCNISINDRILITFGQFVPAPRYAVSSEIIGDRLYVIGGQVSSGGTYNTSTTSREVIYLDLSKSFSSSLSPWVDYSNTSPLPVLNSWADSCQVKNNKIYIFGGIIRDVNTNNVTTDNNKQIYVFDTTKNTWTSLVATGTSVAPSRRREMKITMDDSGKIYVFGGSFDSTVGGPTPSIWLNDTTIFDSNLLTWTQTTPTNLPTSRLDFTATYLPKNKLIVYIGGTEIRADGFSYPVNINQISTFDTVSLTWSTKTAGGIIVDNRYGHSAVLTSDYRIICYGGSINHGATPKPSLLVLDVSTDNYQLSAPTTTTSNQPPNLVYHTAKLYQNTMIMTFGNMTQSGGMLNRQLFLLDTKSYTWVTNFQGNSSTSSSSYTPSNSGVPSSTNANSTSSNSSNLSSSAIIIAVSVLGSLVVIISVIAIIILVLRYRKKNQKGKNHQNYQNPNNPNFQNSPNYQNNPNFQNGLNYQNNPNFQNGPNYQNYPNFQNGLNYQNYPNFQNGSNYQNNQNVIKIPGSTGHNELTYSHYH